MLLHDCRQQQMLHRLLANTELNNRNSENEHALAEQRRRHDLPFVLRNQFLLGF